MYNRYIPQPDGTYRRSYVPDRAAPSQEPACAQPHREEEQPPCEPQSRQESCDSPSSKKPPYAQSGRSREQGRRCSRPSPPPPRQESCRDSHDGSIGGFLRNLLPRDFDTADLLIVLLLLLMAGDCADDQNTALLTLALYLFM